MWIAASFPAVQESGVISLILDWALMNSDQLFSASEVINFAIVVLTGTKMAAADIRKARCPSCSMPEPVVCQSSFSQMSWQSLLAGTLQRVSEFVSSPAKEKLDELQCASHTVVLTVERPGRTWRTTLAACNSAEGQQSEVAISEPLSASASLVILTLSWWLEGLKEIRLLVLSPEVQGK